MNRDMKGKSNHSLDSKGRLIIPSRLRAGLGSSFVLCKGMDKNIIAYPMEEWEKFSERLNALPVSDKDARSFKRFFQGSACDCELDGNSRIVIPQALREWAGIDKEVVMVGYGNTAEIWNVDSFDEKDKYSEGNIDEISADMSAKYNI